MLKRFCAALCVVSILVGCSGNGKTSQANDSLSESTIDNIDRLGNEMYMFVGTYTGADSKGIYVYALDTVEGTSRYISEVEVSNPSFITLDKSETYLYAVSEEDDIKTAAANAFFFDKEQGTLTFINKQLTGGGAPCHITIDDSGKHLVVANYLGGSLSQFNIMSDGTLEPATQSISFVGKGIDTIRQEGPHIHFAAFTPDGKYLLSNDLGTDKIYKFDLNEADSLDFLSIGSPPSFKVKGGAGPRHLDFHPSGKYVYLITELSGDVLVFDYEDGILKEKQIMKADTLNAKGSADIHVSPDGRFVYASNRLEGDGIVIFSVNPSDGKLEKVGYQATAKHPRNFAITPNGKLLLVANRDSDLIQVFERDTDTGLLQNTEHDIELSMPVCIKFASFY